MSISVNYSLPARVPAAAWAQTGRDVLNGAGAVAKQLVAVSGLALLAVFVALGTSEQVRDQAASIVRAGFGEPANGAVPEPKHLPTEVKSGRWSDWLATSPGNGRLDTHQENVAKYLAQRYRVADGAVRQIVGAAYGAGRSNGVDPLLVLAVTAIESSLNPFAQSPMGAQGLMQVMTRVHSEKFASHGGDHAALDPLANMAVGSEILKDLISRGGSVERGLQLYVGAGNLPDDGGYADRVLGERERIRIAASGDVRGALAAGWRSDSRPRAKPAPELTPVQATDPAATPLEHAASMI